ncbi:hypothetical protein C1645_829930 [Glomus cerebriforme]|uniref:Uncharacterized protein n=1 Tax=Glomus cerebriforme TaxID=658196 RepID=A0A397SPN8_9GLOM|nr:hypothetical protein C1645_829930 [Glomus cerebriforme]
MSSETSIPYIPASTSTSITGNEMQKIIGREFLKMMKKDFTDIALKARPALRLADFTKKCKDKKLKAFSSYKSLKEVLKKYDIDSNGMDTIPLFSLQTHEIKDFNKHFEHYVKNILFRIKHYGLLVLDNLKSMCNEYVSTILYTVLHIAGNDTGEISQASEVPVTIEFNKKALNKESEEYKLLCNGVKKILNVVVSLLKDKTCAEDDSPSKKKARIEEYCSKK